MGLVEVRKSTTQRGASRMSGLESMKSNVQQLSARKSTRPLSADALDVFSFGGVDADDFAFLDEMRHADDKAGFELGGLQNVADGG